MQDDLRQSLRTSLRLGVRQSQKQAMGMPLLHRGAASGNYTDWQRLDDVR
jgi:hypothetical protein